MLLTSDLHHLYCSHKAAGGTTVKSIFVLLFQSSRSLCHLKFFRLQAWWGKQRNWSLTLQIPFFPSIPLLQSTLLRTVIHFWFQMFPGYTSPLLFTVSQALPRSPSPTRRLRVAVHLQAVCGMVLWAGIWQPLIRNE